MYHTDISTICSQRSPNVSVTLTWTAVTAASSVLTNNGPLWVLLPPWQTRPFITALPDLSAPAPRSDSHTDHPSCRQKPDSAPGRETLTERLGVVRAFHRDLHKKEFLWPICAALRGEEGIYGYSDKHLLLIWVEHKRHETQLDNYMCSLVANRSLVK